MLSETQEIRKRPFSVNEMNRRTREVKICNTTTITTTSTSTATDSIIKSTDMYNSDNYGSFQQRNDCRSKSAQGVINVNRENKNNDTCYANITTNTSISLPIKRKIRFIYGENQPENQTENQIKIKGTSHENKSNQQARDKSNCDCAENISKFPYEKKEENINEEYDNFDFRKNCSMKVKDVEVECEIDEDPAIFEGSEGYVKKLINKIQQQYKNPETVHIKITRRQRPKLIDENDGTEHGQVVKKEYYTIKNLRRQKKSSSISSFIDQTNIPYIDEESLNDSRNSWYKNKINDNYIIEKHEIYDQDKIKEEKIKDGIKGFFKGIGGKIKAPDVHILDVSVSGPDINLPKFKGPKFEGPDFNIKGPKVDVPDVSIDTSLPNVDVDLHGPKFKGPKVDLPDVDLDLKGPKISGPSIDINAPDVDLNAPDVKGGLKGFFKGIGGKIKAPDVHIPDVSVSGPDINLPKFKGPKFEGPDFNIKGPKVDVPDVSIDTGLINPSKSVISPIFNSIIPDIYAESNNSFDEDLKDYFYGIDLPMTIVNHDWYWSPHNIVHSSLDKLHFQTSLAADNDLFPFGKYFVANQSSKPTQIPFSSLNIDYEFHKAKIRLDSVDPASNPPGESSPLNEISTASFTTIKPSKTTKLRHQSSSSVNRPEKKSSLFSTKSFRSLSVDGHPKADSSQPRKVFIQTMPGFDGLGVHIACDRKSRCSSYIYEIESNSPGAKAGLKEKEFILEINDEDVVFLDFDLLIKKIQTLIKENSLSLTVGNEKAFKKWVKTHKKK